MGGVGPGESQLRQPVIPASILYHYLVLSQLRVFLSVAQHHDPHRYHVHTQLHVSLPVAERHNIVGVRQSRVDQVNARHRTPG